MLGLGEGTSGAASSSTSHHLNSSQGQRTGAVRITEDHEMDAYSLVELPSYVKKGDSGTESTNEDSTVNGAAPRLVSGYILPYAYNPPSGGPPNPTTHTADDSAGNDSAVPSMNRELDPDLPPYVGSNDDDVLPAYTRAPPVASKDTTPEPPTAAEFLFKLGFLFPPLWIIGSLLLVSPFRPYHPPPVRSTSSGDQPVDPNSCQTSTSISSLPSSSQHRHHHFSVHIRNPITYPWLSLDATEAQISAFHTRMREVEKTWAKRCLLALGLLTCFLVAVVITVWAVVRTNPSITSAPSGQ